MIFGSGSCLVAEVNLNVSKPRKVVPRREDSGDCSDPRDIDCPRDRADAFAQLGEEGIDDLGGDMCSGRGIASNNPLRRQNSSR